MSLGLLQLVLSLVLSLVPCWLSVCHRLGNISG